MVGTANKRGLLFVCISLLVFSIISIYLKNNKTQREKGQRVILGANCTSERVLPNILLYTTDLNFRGCESGSEHRVISCPVTESNIVNCNIYHGRAKVTAIGAYIIYGPSFSRFPQYRNSNILWGLFDNESPRANALFMNDKLFELFNFSTTYSRYSDAPFPLNYLQAYKNEKEEDPFMLITSKEYHVNTTMKNYYLKEIAPIIYLQSNPLTFNDRDKYVLKMMEYIDIDSYGDSVNNRKLPKELNFPGTEKYKRAYISQLSIFKHYTARYKFQIAIESGVCADYASEKLWRPIEQGVVPIYFGSPTVRDWLPNPKSAILIEDFATPELLARHLHELLSNDTKYEEYLEHKTKGIISNEKLINELKTRPLQWIPDIHRKKLECILCQRLHEVNSSKINMVSRKARDCEMPWSLLTRAPDLNNTYMEVINKAKKIVDAVYQNYVNRIPLGNTLNNDAFSIFRNKPNLIRDLF